MRRISIAVAMTLALAMLAGCASHSTALPPVSTSHVSPFVNQTGDQNGWQTLPLVDALEGTPTTVGQDGAFWNANFDVQDQTDGVVRTTIAGVQNIYPVTPGLDGFAITPNPDGNIYVAERDPSFNMSVAQVTPEGAITYFPVPGHGAIDNDIILQIVSASDGNLWMTGNAGGNSFIAEMTTAGVVTIINSQSPCSPHDLVRGPDKNLWVDCGNAFARISVPDGTVTLFPLNVRLNGVVEGSDGAVWGWSPFGTGGLVRIDMSGNVTNYPLHVRDPVTAGPQHKLYWFDKRTQRIDSFSEINRTRSGNIALPPGISFVEFMSETIGSDKQLWLFSGFDAYAYALHPLIVTPSPIVVQANASAPVSVVEKGSPQHAFSAVSNDPSIATVTGSGKSFTVTGIATGNTTITFSDQIGNSLDVPVTVN